MKKLAIMGVLLMGIVYNPIQSKIIVLIGPSGVGKSTLMNKLSDDNIPFRDIVSHTTRPSRQGELDGKDYFFVTEQEYNKKSNNGDFIISTKVHGNWYGIDKNYINNLLEEGHNLICSLNTEAAHAFKSLYKNEVVTIFIAPPSYEELEKRIMGRDKVLTDAIKLRLENAHSELKLQDSFDYKIINDNIIDAYNELTAILKVDTPLKLRVKQVFPDPIDEPITRVMSYNIRMAPCIEDENTENEWKHRLHKVGLIIGKYKPDIIGLQELSAMQMSSLNKILLPTYGIVGKFPTKKPVESGLGFVYNIHKVKPISGIQTTWLNEDGTTHKSPSWDGSEYERFVIYAKFMNKETGNVFWFMTTHFDHLGVRARQESAKIVLGIADKLDAPTILTGDFNCFPQLGGAELYTLLCAYSKKIKDSGIKTSMTFGLPGTWIGWDYDIYKQKIGHAKYDFIFVSESIDVKLHAVIDDKVWDKNFNKELYPSDHRPVLSDLYL